MLSQRISYIVISRYSAYIYITPIYDLPNQMETSEYVFGALMRSGFFRLSNGPVVVTEEINGVCDARNHSEILDELPYPNSFLSSV